MVSLYYLLLKKTLRDFVKLLGPSLTLSFVMAAGVSCLVMARSNLISLQKSQRLTYESLNFAGALIPLSRIARERVGSLAKISGIRQADCRISLSGQVRLSKFEKQISARFHSMPRDDAPNGILLTDSRRPAADSIHEAVLSDGFARAWGFSSGQQIEVFLQGKPIRLTISGLARSAEYVYQTGSATSIPDDKLFAIWWLQPRLLEQAGNLHSSCNEILLKTGNEGNLLKAEAQLAARLKAAGAVTLQDFESLRTRVRDLQGEIQSAQTTLDAARHQRDAAAAALSKTPSTRQEILLFRAPRSGIVSRIYDDKLRFALLGTPLMDGQSQINSHFRWMCLLAKE